MASCGKIGVSIVSCCGTFDVLLDRSGESQSGRSILGAIGVDRVQLGQVASRGAVGLVKSGKKTNANNNFATARAYAPAIA